MKLPSVPTEVEYVSFGGGLDVVTSPLKLNPGAAIAAVNYEPGVSGSYPRIDGYERTSGLPSPSDATYLYCQVVFNATVAERANITGSVSGATATVVVVGTTDMAITKVVGTFTASENFTVAGVVVGHMDALPVEGGYSTGLEDATARAAAADCYRDDIAEPAGSGPVRGGFVLEGENFCFRDNPGATAGLLLKATPTGWEQIVFYKELDYTGGSALIADGTSIAQLTSGATATVKRQVLESGAFDSSTAAGRLILASITGTFDATHAIQVSGVTKCTAASLATQITRLPAGRIETHIYNFTGYADTVRCYGADGVNPAFEFDGDVYIPIYTGMTEDTPLHVISHKKMLHLTFRGSFQSSAIGNPFSWSAVVGASEIGMGGVISGMLAQAGDTLAISTRNQTNQLSGFSADSFELDILAADVGAIPYTMQNLGTGFWLDDRGVVELTRTAAYGNFENATISRRIQPILTRFRENVIASSVYRSRNQYRLYCSDGTGIIMTVAPGQRGPEYHFTQLQYPVNVACAWNGEGADGKEVIYFGSDAGMVYQADRGSSFDGEEIEAFLRMAFNHSKSPQTIKSYRLAKLELTTTGYSEIRVHPEFSYGDPQISTHMLTDFESQGRGGYYGSDFYETIYYDRAVVESPSIHLSGDGTNMGLVIYSNSAIDRGHSLQGVVLTFSPRRNQR